LEAAVKALFLADTSTIWFWRLSLYSVSMFQDEHSTPQRYELNVYGSFSSFSGTEKYKRAIFDHIGVKHTIRPLGNKSSGKFCVKSVGNI